MRVKNVYISDNLQPIAGMSCKGPGPKTGLLTSKKPILLTSRSSHLIYLLTEQMDSNLPDYLCLQVAFPMCLPVWLILILASTQYPNIL